MNKFLASIALFAAMTVPASAALISVENIGAILNESLALPAEDTPGSGIAFAEFFEFTLPVAETVTVSMSDSGIGSEQVTGGLLSLNRQTSTGPGPLFIPAGPLIESSTLNAVIGGQEATVSPDALSAGSYFAELSGVSGTAPLHLAVDGTVTATVPETRTWVMLVIGFGVMMWGFKRPKLVARLST